MVVVVAVVAVVLPRYSVILAVVAPLRCTTARWFLPWPRGADSNAARRSTFLDPADGLPF